MSKMDHSRVNHPRIEMVLTSSLKPNPRNARTHSDKQIGQIAASIDRFGFLVPIIIDDTDMIAAGHARWLAAKQSHQEEVPVIRACFLSDADKRAFVLAENKLSDLSGWDENILAEELIFLFEGGYELEITGFSVADIDFSVPEPASKEKPETVELPDPEQQAVTRQGDVWELGPHLILCGDARDVSSWEQLLGERRAVQVFSDPPYNVPIDGFVSGSGRHREFVMGSGEMTSGEHTAFLRSVFRNCVRFSVSGSIHFHCMDWRHIEEILDAARGVYDAFKQLIVWSKSQGGLGTFYRSQHELVFVFKAGKAKHINNFGLGENGRYRTNVVSYPGANTFRKGRKRDLADHSTIKPVALVADFLLDCSNRGDLVVDPFLGSGTTLIAAHRTHRIGAGIELDPLYVDTAIKRIQDSCELTATLQRDGRSFDEITAARKAENDA